MEVYMNGGCHIQIFFILKPISRYIINNLISVFTKQIFIQAVGMDRVSGTFKMTISDEVIQVDFNYEDGQMPSLNHKTLSPGPYEIKMIGGITVEGSKINCTLELYDPRK